MTPPTESTVVAYSAEACIEVSKKVDITTCGDTHEVILFLNGTKVAQELATALHRALNTWERPPSWLLELADALDKQGVPR